MRFHFFMLIKVIYIIRLMWLRKAVPHPCKPGWGWAALQGGWAAVDPPSGVLHNPITQKKIGNSHLACHSFVLQSSFHMPRISTAVLKGLKEGMQGFRPTPRGFDFFSQKCFDRKYFLPCNLKAWNLPEQSVPSTQTWQYRMFNKYMFLFT